MLCSDYYLSGDKHPALDQAEQAHRNPRSLSVKNGSFIPRDTVRALNTGLCHDPPRVTRSVSPAGSSRPSSTRYG